jgi:hypothetical protein
MLKCLVVPALFVCSITSAAGAQGRPDTQALIAAQKQALQRFAYMDGVWRGTASTTVGPGQTHVITQTERIGPFLDGSVKVIEGRGYDDDGRVSFNAFGIISFDPAKNAYTMRSYALGQSGDFPVNPTEDGMIWEIPAGPATIRYTATVKDGTWHEVGERVVQGRDPVRFFEMTLKRVGDTTWPAAGAIPPQ